MSSWILVGFLTTEPQRELPQMRLLHVAVCEAGRDHFWCHFQVASKPEHVSRCLEGLWSPARCPPPPPLEFLIQEPPAGRGAGLGIRTSTQVPGHTLVSGQGAALRSTGVLPTSHHCEPPRNNPSPSRWHCLYGTRVFAAVIALGTRRGDHPGFEVDPEQNVVSVPEEERSSHCAVLG